MPTRSIFVVATSLVLSVARARLCGCGCAALRGERRVLCAGGADLPSAAPPRARHVYRLDFVVSPGDAGKTGSGTYSVNVEEDQWRTSSRVGANVALSGASRRAPMVRQDVGLMLRYNVSSRSATICSSTATLELSAFEEPARISKLTTSSDALVALGKPALVASVDDPGGPPPLPADGHGDLGARNGRIPGASAGARRDRTRQPSEPGSVQGGSSLALTVTVFKVSLAVLQEPTSCSQPVPTPAR